MKKILKKLMLGLAVLVVLVLVVSLFLPSKWRVERSIVIAARPEAIYPLISRIRQWPEWTAWTKEKDPTLTFNYSGPEQGVGATSKWTSEKMGSGTAVITAADPQKGVTFDLNMEEGKFKSTAIIAMEPAGDGTRVIWSNYGELGWNPVARYFGLMFEKWIGPDYEEGLRNLKQKLEKKGN